VWIFREKAPGEKIRNPIQGEFFATDSIRGPAQALIRESFRSSLDARSGHAPADSPIRIRVKLATGERALPADRIRALFE
jgi:hypothetical protein